MTNKWPSQLCCLHLFILFSQLEPFAAEGPVFSSGHDLKELTDEQGPEYHAEVFQTCSEVSQEDNLHCNPENDNYTH